MKNLEKEQVSPPAYYAKQQHQEKKKTKQAFRLRTTSQNSNVHISKVLTLRTQGQVLLFLLFSYLHWSKYPHLRRLDETAKYQ